MRRTNNSVSKVAFSRGELASTRLDGCSGTVGSPDGGLACVCLLDSLTSVQRDGLGLRLGGRRRRNVDLDCRAGIDAMAGITDRAAVDGNGARLDQCLESGARKLGNVRGEHAIEPSAGLIVGDADGFHGRIIGISHGHLNAQLSRR